jgi:dephospho-CoA kinase
VALLDGSIDRPALARIVFSDNAARADLNAIIHPIVRKRMRDREGEARPDQLLVHEAPLLFEAGVDRECDVTVVVVAPKEVRIERVAARNSLDRDEIERRMAAQLDPDRVRELATYTIENDGTLKELHAKVAALYAEKLLP